ncbi:hypothetical protein J2W79_000847 [Methylorubrum extorquens]|nr:hypothetical protein [Methylorubrum extorquens]
MPSQPRTGSAAYAGRHRQAIRSESAAFMQDSSTAIRRR